MGNIPGMILLFKGVLNKSLRTSKSFWRGISFDYLYKKFSFITLHFIHFIMKVAVTGASGHIGNCLVQELKKQGAGIKVLVHNFRSVLDEMDIELIQGNLLEPESLVNLCEGVDVVFHLAAQIAIENTSSEHVYETNVTGTK